ncbi:trp operon leader peptide [Salmonella enterica]|nr:trp operon leader peptide [Salmonella enterica subsp. enterica serovar Mbandaka]EHX5265934.1 trp operon leader peptide [Salmonella enterica]
MAATFALHGWWRTF